MAKYENVYESENQQDLRYIIADAVNGIGLPQRSSSRAASEADVIVLAQRTIYGVLGGNNTGMPRGSISTVFSRLEGIDHENRLVTIVMICTLEDGSDEWVPAAMQVRTHPNRLPKAPPSDRRISLPTMVVAPPIGIACGVIVQDRRRLTVRFQVPGRSAVEDSSSESVFAFALTASGKTGWENYEAPTIELINDDGTRLIPMQTLTMPELTQDA